MTLSHRTSMRPGSKQTVGRNNQPFFVSVSRLPAFLITSTLLHRFEVWTLLSCEVTNFRCLKFWCLSSFCFIWLICLKSERLVVFAIWWRVPTCFRIWAIAPTTVNFSCSSKTTEVVYVFTIEQISRRQNIKLRNESGLREKRITVAWRTSAICPPGKSGAYPGGLLEPRPLPLTKWTINFFVKNF